jgi:hypothetical protein
MIVSLATRLLQGADLPRPSHGNVTALASSSKFKRVRRVNFAMNFPALVFLGASGLLSRGFEDQPRDFVGMGDQREMAGLHLDGLGAHALGHEAFEIGIDRAVFG